MFRLGIDRNRRRRHTNAGRPHLYEIEQLETRRLLSTVTWTGAAGDRNWTTSGNWSGGMLPASADDAVIPAGFTGITLATGTQSVKSLSSASPILAFYPAELDLGAGGATLAANLTFYGGTIRGGVVRFVGSAALIGTQDEGTLDAVTLLGNMDLSQEGGATVEIKDGLTLDGTVFLGGTNLFASLVFTGSTSQSFTTTPGGSAHVLFGASRYNTLENRTANLFSSPIGKPVTIGPGVLIDGQNGSFGNIVAQENPQGSEFINQGTISADSPGGTLNVKQPLVNQGNVLASNGGSLILNEVSGNLGQVGPISSYSALTLGGDYTIDDPIDLTGTATVTLNGNWANRSTITLNSGTLNLGGDFTTQAIGAIIRPTLGAGQVNLIGTVENAGATFAISPSLAPWNLSGGEIRNGTVVSDGTGLIFTPSGGTLDGVIYRGVLDLGEVDVATVSVLNGLTLDGTMLLGNSAGTTKGILTFIGNGPETLDAPPGATADLTFGASAYNALINSIDYIMFGNYTGPGAPLTLGSRVRVGGKNGDLVGALFGDQIINQGLISSPVKGGTILVGNPLVNQGTITAANGGTLNLANVTGNLGTVSGLSNSSALILGGTYTIDQPITLDSGASLTLGGNWKNASTLTENASTLFLGGSFATADIGTILGTAGTINLTGKLDNSGTVFNLDPLGPVHLYGSIRGGVISASGDTTLLIGEGGLLDGVTLNGNTQGYLTVMDDLVLNGTMTVNGQLTFGDDNSSANPATESITGNANLVLKRGLFNSGSIINDAGRVGTPGTLILGPGVTVSGGTGVIESLVGGPIINRGTIRADVPGKEIDVIYAGPLTNEGTLQATNGGRLNVSSLTGSLGTVSVSGNGSSLILYGENYVVSSDLTVPVGSKLELDGSWSNAATVTVAGGTLNLGGSFTVAGMGVINRTGPSTINLTGILDNAANTFTFNASTGSWNLLGGGIKGGTVIESNSAGLIFLTGAAGSLDGVNFVGNLDLSQVNGAALAVADGLTLNGQILLGNASGTNHGELDFGGKASQTLSAAPGGSAMIVLGASNQNAINNFPYRAIAFSVTFGPDVRISARNGSMYENTSRSIPFINQGTFTLASGGNFQIDAPLLNQGQLSLANSATLTALAVTNDGTITLAPNATVAVVGDNYYGGFTQTSDGTLVDQFSGPSTGANGRITASGSVNLSGTLEVDWPQGVDPTPGATLAIVTGSSRTGTFSKLVIAPPSMAGKLRVQYTSNSAYLLEGGDVVPGTAGNDAITLAADPDGTDIDWISGSTNGFLPIADPRGLTINGNGGSDTLSLDYSKGDPLPAMLHLNGTFTINGLHSLGGTVLDIGKTTVYISYAGAADPISWVRSALREGYNGGKWNGIATAATGSITTSAGSTKFAIGYADAADGSRFNPIPNTVELKYTVVGDANLDGQVTVADLFAFARNRGKPAAWNSGDFNYDGSVDGLDLLILLRHFGQDTRF